MKAAWYEKQGAATDVLVVGEMNDPQPRAGEVRIRVAFSGVNPGDVKKRELRTKRLLCRMSYDTRRLAEEMTLASICSSC
jgi:NADPH:quinone reductase-like Zn-dependent oxidoreductase